MDKQDLVDTLNQVADMVHYLQLVPVNELPNKIEDTESKLLPLIANLEQELEDEKADRSLDSERDMETEDDANSVGELN